MANYVIKKYATHKKAPNRKGKYQPRFDKTKVNVAECVLCGDIVFSRTRHDYRSCSCGNTSVDGGFDYFKPAWAKKKPYTYTLNIVQTKHQLYDDWNTSANIFGVITFKTVHLYGIAYTKYQHTEKDGIKGRMMHRLQKADEEKNAPKIIKEKTKIRKKAEKNEF